MIGVCHRFPTVAVLCCRIEPKPVIAAAKKALETSNPVGIYIALALLLQFGLICVPVNSLHSFLSIIAVTICYDLQLAGYFNGLF